MSRFNHLEFGGQSREDSSFSEGIKDGAFYLAEGQRSLENGRFEEALRAYAKVLEFDPGCVGAWVGQVRMLVELGEFREAKLWAEKALEAFPQEAELLAAKAVALARSGDLDGALAFSDAAVEARTPTMYIWLARGDVLLARAEARAEFCMSKALALGGQDWVAQWLVGRVYCFYRKFSRGLRVLQRALDLDPARAVVWMQYGRCQLALGLPRAAAECFGHARELDPQCQPAATDLLQLSEAGIWMRVRGWWRRAFR